MKIIHCADLHLDSKLSANLSADKARERKNELLEAFMRMIRYAVDNNVNAIIIAGDLFDTRKISATACNVVRDAIVNNPEIEFYYLQGNHDANSFLARLEEIPANLKLFGNSWTSHELCGNENVFIYGIELNGFNSPDWFNTLVLDVQKTNIVVLHGQESLSKSKNQAEVIPFLELRNKNIDYLALGHIHGYKKEKLDNRGIYCYPGCLEPRGLDEPGDHGFVVLEIGEDNKIKSHEFVKNASRTLHEIRVDVTDCMTTSDISTRVETELSLKNLRSSEMLKLVLCGELDVTAEKDIELLNHSLEGRFYIVRVYDETRLKVNVADYMHDESLKGEFVRNVLEDNELTDEEKMTVISYGIRALSGEEITL